MFRGPQRSEVTVTGELVEGLVVTTAEFGNLRRLDIVGRFSVHLVYLAVQIAFNISTGDPGKVRAAAGAVTRMPCRRPAASGTTSPHREVDCSASG
jgi:hypothetical protein